MLWQHWAGGLGPGEALCLLLGRIRTLQVFCKGQVDQSTGRVGHTGVTVTLQGLAGECWVLIHGKSAKNRELQELICCGLCTLLTHQRLRVWIKLFMKTLLIIH